MRVSYSKGSLTTRANKTDGRFYAAQFRYQLGSKWKTRLVILTDEKGQKVPADAAMTRNKRAATAALNRARIALGGAIMDGAQSVPDYVKNDLEGRKGTIEDSTLRGYLTYMPVFENGLSRVAMRDLSPKDVRLWVQGLISQNKAPRTVRKAFNLLSNICDRAVENNDLHTNPCTEKIRREDLPRIGSPIPNALDSIGVRRVNSLLNDANNVRLKIGARIALHCGLRASEVCGLKWCDVDFKAELIHVHTAIGNRGSSVQGATSYVKRTKSNAGDRYIPLTKTLIKELTEWKKAQQNEYNKVNHGSKKHFEQCYVIGYVDGSFYTPHSLERLWGKLAKGKHPKDPTDKRRRLQEGYEEGYEPITGITGDIVTFHGLRHTYATGLIKAGADVKAASALLGHADAAMTLRVYAAADPEAVKDAAKNAAPLLELGATRTELKVV